MLVIRHDDCNPACLIELSHRLPQVVQRKAVAGFQLGSLKIPALALGCPRSSTPSPLLQTQTHRTLFLIQLYPLAYVLLLRLLEENGHLDKLANMARSSTIIEASAYLCIVDWEHHKVAHTMSFQREWPFVSMKTRLGAALLKCTGGEYSCACRAGHSIGNVPI